MKKLLIAMVFVLMVSLFASIPAYAEDEYDDSADYENSGESAEYALNGEDVEVLGGSFEARYQNNLKFMNSQFTDLKRLKLFLRPSYNINSESDEIIALAKTITASLTDDYAKAQSIHNWVCQNIYYDFDTDDYVFGNDGSLVETQDAEYVLQDKKGVCDGYTNLTCALLRAAGIPAQAYEGYVYSDSEWGPHAWTGAYISSQNKWIVLDTTFDSFNSYSDGEYSAGNTRQDYFDPDLNTFSQDHFYFTAIFAAYIDEEADLDIAEDYGAELDYNRTDLYFYFKEASIGKYSRCSYSYGVGVWTTESLRFYTYDSWVSSNPKVATVNQFGEVTAHEYGTATISLAFLDKGMEASFVLTVAPQKMSLSCTSLNVGETYKVAVDEDSYNSGNSEFYYKDLTWKSSNPKVLTVDKNGVATAVGSGTAKITATTADGSSSATTEVEVYAVLTGIKISHKTLTVTPNSEVEVLVNGSPKGAVVSSQFLSWTSSNPKVATIDTSGNGLGLLTALKEGSATITAYVWKYDDDGNEVILFSDTCKVTVKAEKEYKVTFTENGGTAVKDLKVKSNSTITKPANPTKSGYKFVGWYKDNNCTKAWNFTATKVTANTTLYAKWEKTKSTAAKYKVTFIANNGVSPKTTVVTKGSKISEPETPSPRNGYKFVGWYKDSKYTQKWDFATSKVTANTTLYAGWKKI